MSQPAARVTDMHVCPMVTGIVPHVGGPILPPAAVTVLTCKLPQARLTDMCVCVGPPDIIVSPGAPTVLVMKLPAARMGDMTAHGGVIVMGCFTVLIGSAGAVPTSIMVGTAITIEGDLAFQQAAVAALNQIASTPSGAQMLSDIEKAGKPVKLVEGAPGTDSCGGFDPTAASNGTGSGSTVRWNPNQSTMYDGSEPWMTAPPGVILGHEMTHAAHVARGEVDMTMVQNDGRTDPTHPTGNHHWYAEEVRTAGIPPYNDPKTTPYSENTIRSEWDPPQPQRRYY